METKKTKYIKTHNNILYINKEIVNCKIAKALSLLMILVFLVLFNLSCSYKELYRIPLNTRVVQTMTLVSGYEEIKLQNNTIHLCDPISGTITKYYSYGVNTITVEPYTQIRFTRDNIFYVSVKDWNMHMLDNLGQELSVMSIRWSFPLKTVPLETGVLT